MSAATDETGPDWLTLRRAEHLVLSTVGVNERGYDCGPFSDVMWDEYPRMLDVIETARAVADAEIVDGQRYPATRRALDRLHLTLDASMPGAGEQ